MKVYAVTYNSCVHESGYCVISLHMTIKGAVQAMIELKNVEFVDYWLGGFDRYISITKVSSIES